MFMQNSICIALPTYERPVELARVLAIICQNIIDKDNINIFVSDNSEDFQIALENRQICELNPKINYFHNSCNLGFGGNLLRLLKLTQGYDYLWYLSDDDLVNEESLGIFLDFISNTEAKPELIMIPFKASDTGFIYNTSTEYGNANNVEDLFYYAPKFPFILFSSFVLRVSDINHDAILAELASYAANDLVQVAIAISVLTSKSSVFYWPTPVIEYIPGDVGRFLPSSLLSSEIDVINYAATRFPRISDRLKSKIPILVAAQIKHSLRVRAGIQKNSNPLHRDFGPFSMYSYWSKFPSVNGAVALLCSLLPNKILSLLARGRKHK
jgi:hypothetical protein